MSAIPDRVWELLTEDEQQRLREVLIGWRHEPIVTCPQCSARIGVRLSVKAGAVLVDDRGVPLPSAKADAPQPTPKATTPDPTNPLLVAEAKLIEEAERTGLLAAFANAVREDKPTNVPSDMGRHLVTFLRTAAAKRVPQFAIDFFNAKHTGHLTFWSAQGVMAVSVDGIIREFVPLRFIAGAAVTTIGTNTMKGRLMADHRDLDVWVKGRFGYVPMHSENYLDAMRRQNIGKFGVIVQ